MNIDKLFNNLPSSILWNDEKYILMLEKSEHNKWIASYQKKCRRNEVDGFIANCNFALFGKNPVLSSVTIAGGEFETLIECYEFLFSAIQKREKLNNFKGIGKLKE